MVSSMRHKTTVVIAAIAVIAPLIGCGGEQSQVSVDLFGWEGDFTSGMPAFDGAEELSMAVTDPDDDVIIDEQIVDVGMRAARMPELPGGEGLRMEFEVRDGDGDPIATASTPRFDVDEEAEHFSFRTMIAPVDQFAPAGSRQRDPDTGELTYRPSTFDIREYDHVNWSGRTGHTAHTTDTGEVMIVGGARVGVNHEPSTLPVLNVTLGDIQLFDPATGYFTELGGLDDAVEADRVGEDRLDQRRAFHTVTPIGDDRFVIVGGFRIREGSTVPVDTIELIDLTAEPGERVRQIDGAEQLQMARGLHTATYRESDGTVVVAGGLGTDNDDVIDTIEIIDPVEGSVDTVNMQTPRVGHSAALLGDGETIWFIGGKSGQDTLLDSTELFGAGTATESGPTLKQPLYETTAVSLGEAGNNQIAIFGGFTDGGVTADYVLGNPLQDQSLHGEGNWRLGTARAAPDIVTMPQSGDLVVIGGYDAAGEPLGSTERLELNIESLPPFDIDAGLGDMTHRRANSAVVLADNGRVFIAGGDDPEDVERNDAEYFNVYDPVGR